MRKDQSKYLPARYYLLDSGVEFFPIYTVQGYFAFKSLCEITDKGCMRCIILCMHLTCNKSISSSVISLSES